jgi:hypothetical protein
MRAHALHGRVVLFLYVYRSMGKYRFRFFYCDSGAIVATNDMDIDEEADCGGARAVLERGGKGALERRGYGSCHGCMGSG